jgi:hypothetical protein
MSSSRLGGTHRRPKMRMLDPAAVPGVRYELVVEWTAITRPENISSRMTNRLIRDTDIVEFDEGHAVSNGTVLRGTPRHSSVKKYQLYYTPFGTQFQGSPPRLIWIL